MLTSIYSDEVMHARLGWSYLRYAIEVGGQGVIDAAAEMLPRALRGVANVVERERPVGEVTEASEIKGGVQVKASFTLEVKDAERPALVADCLFRYYA